MIPGNAGEDQAVAALLAHLPPPEPRHGVIAGAGDDDCAVVRLPRRGNRLLLKTDCVIEGVHFLPDASPRQVGWKALCRPLSDIAATGGKPLHALVTLAVRQDKIQVWAGEVYAGIGDAAREFRVAIVGGETASSPGPCFISVALTGRVHKDCCITRGGGRCGDVLFVTGSLGGSFPSGKHLDFRPRLAEGRWLARQGAVRAMMDLSDGLAADLPRLATTSGTGYRLDPSKLPLNRGCTISAALADGEDYELLLAVDQRRAAKLESAWKRRFPGLSLTPIGFLAEPAIAEGLEGHGGFDHFVPRAVER